VTASEQSRNGAGWDRGRAILRHRVERDFTVLSNAVIRDKRLGFKAFGVLVYLLHLPPDFHVSVDWLSRQRSTGRYAIRAAIEELRVLGYMGVEVVRDSTGRFAGWIWWVTDSPSMEKRDGQPVSGFPISGNPKSGNRNLISTNKQQEPSLTTTTAPASAIELPRGLPEEERVVVGRLLKDLEPGLAQQVLDELAGLMAANRVRTSRIALLRELVARARSGAFTPAHAPSVARRRAQEAEQVLQRAAKTQEAKQGASDVAKARFAEIAAVLRMSNTN